MRSSGAAAGAPTNRLQHGKLVLDLGVHVRRIWRRASRAPEARVHAAQETDRESRTRYSAAASSKNRSTAGRATSRATPSMCTFTTCGASFIRKSSRRCEASATGSIRCSRRRLGRLDMARLSTSLDSGASPDCILFALLVILGVAAWGSYEVAKHEAEELFGARLATSARVLEALVARAGGSTPRSRNRS